MDAITLTGVGLLGLGALGGASKWWSGRQKNADPRPDVQTSLNCVRDHVVSLPNGPEKTEGLASCDKLAVLASHKPEPKKEPPVAPVA